MEGCFNMIHETCSNNVGIELDNYILVSISSVSSGGAIYAKILDLYKKKDSKNVQEDINFVCNRCGRVDKSEILSQCDYCGSLFKIDKLFFSERKNGMFCKKCGDENKITDKESLMERLLTHGIVLP
jgi:hypothetical protein